MVIKTRSNSAAESPIKKLTTRSRSVSMLRRQKDIDKENEYGPFKLRTSDPIDIWMTKTIPRSRKAVEQSKIRTQNMAHVERIILKYGTEQASSKDILFHDPYILTTILDFLNESNSWDIGLANAYLPIIINNEMLLEPSCVSVCLDSLHLICTTLLDNIVSATQQRGIAGIDIAAEERREKAGMVLKILCKLRDSCQLFYQKMPNDDASRLDQIIQRLGIV